jgi:prophage tail gpP-like protein
MPCPVGLRVSNTKLGSPSRGRFHIGRYLVRETASTPAGRERFVDAPVGDGPTVSDGATDDAGEGVTLSLGGEPVHAGTMDPTRTIASSGRRRVTDA